MRILLAVLMLALAALAIPSASADVPDPFVTHCVADENGVAYCHTTVAGTCSYTTVSDAPGASTVACWHTAFGYCSVSPFQNPPNLWCENHQPPDDGRRTSGAEPCQTGIAQTWCDFTVGPCQVRVTPWTAWGDQSVVSDCRTGGAGPTCHTEVHTQGPLAHEHWCAF